MGRCETASRRGDRGEPDSRSSCLSWCSSWRCCRGCLGPAPDDDTARQELSSTIARGLADQVALGPDIGADYSGLRAVLVLVDGSTVLEQYYGCSRDDAHDLQSVTKSVLATLVGIAVGEGSLRLDDRLATLLPAYAGSMTRATARATLRQVLTMTAGFPDRFEGLDSEFVHSRDWVRDILVSADSPPGERFVYANESAHLVSAILEEATGEPVLAYARSRLFEPLGIVTEPASTSAFRPGRLAGYARSGVAWPVDPQGHATGYSWLRLRPADLARIGQLYLDEGRWDGRQVVPADWVRAATVNASELPVRSANGQGLRLPVVGAHGAARGGVRRPGVRRPGGRGGALAAPGRGHRRGPRLPGRDRPGRVDVADDVVRRVGGRASGARGTPDLTRPRGTDDPPHDPDGSSVAP